MRKTQKVHLLRLIKRLDNIVVRMPEYAKKKQYRMLLIEADWLEEELESLQWVLKNRLDKEYRGRF